MTFPGEPQRTCPACGAPVGPADRFCASCGHDLRVGYVPLVGDEVSDDAVGVHGTTDRPRTGRPARLIVGVLAALVVVVVAVSLVSWLTGGDAADTPGSDEGAAADGGTGDGSGSPSDPANAEPTPTRRTQVRPGPTPDPPMLGAESGLIVVVRAEEGILVVDLDTGEWGLLTGPALGALEGDPGPPRWSTTMTAVGDDVWVMTDATVLELDLDGPGGLVPEAFFLADLGEGDPGDVVGLFPDDGAGAAALADDGMLWTNLGPGRQPVPFVVPPGFEVMGVTDAGVVLTRPEIGGAWVLRDGDPRRIATGLPLALSEGGLLVLDCGDDLNCAFAVVDPGTGEVVRSVPSEPDPELPTPGTTSVLSPDGTLYVLAGGGPGTTESVLDVETGDRIPGLVTGIVTSADFSPDSDWLFLGGDAGERAVLTAVPPDLRLPQRAIATTVELGAATEVVVIGHG